MILRLASILSTMCLLYAATGCGESPKPIPLGSESTKPTASSPSSAVPSLPPEARQKNEAGVKATVEAFAKAKGHAGNTGDTGPFESMYTSECTLCQGATTAVNETYSAGGQYINAGWTIKAIQVDAIEGSLAYVRVTVDTQDNQWVPRSGASPKDFKGKKGYPEFLQLRWMPSGEWKVVAWNPKQ